MAIGVFGILIGLFSLLGYGFHVIALLIPLIMPPEYPNVPYHEHVVRVQIKINRDLAALESDYFAPAIAISLLSMVASCFLIYGGIKVTYRNAPPDLLSYRNVCLAAFFVMLISAAFGFYIQYSTWGIIQRALATLPRAPQQPEFTSLIRTGVYLGVGVSASWKVFQLIYLFVSQWLLKSYSDKLQVDRPEPQQT